jgi:ribosomal protein S27AE/transcription elongation factor Elf1
MAPKASLSHRVSAWRRRGSAKAFERVSTEEAPEQVTGPKGEWERVPEIQEVATAHAFTSMAILGHKMDQGISPSSVLQHLEKAKAHAKAKAVSEALPKAKAECKHVNVRRGANQHGAWTKCKDCGHKISYVKNATAQTTDFAALWADSVSAAEAEDLHEARREAAQVRRDAAEDAYLAQAQAPAQAQAQAQAKAQEGVSTEATPVSQMTLLAPSGGSLVATGIEGGVQPLGVGAHQLGGPRPGVMDTRGGDLGGNSPPLLRGQISESPEAPRPGYVFWSPSPVSGQDDPALATGATASTVSGRDRKDSWVPGVSIGGPAREKENRAAMRAFETKIKKSLFHHAKEQKALGKIPERASPQNFIARLECHPPLRPPMDGPKKVPRCGAFCPECGNGVCEEPPDHPDGLHQCGNCGFAEQISNDIPMREIYNAVMRDLLCAAGKHRTGVSNNIGGFGRLSGDANPTSGGLTVKTKLSRHARRRASADMATTEEDGRHAANSGTDHDGLSDPEDQTTSENLDARPFSGLKKQHCAFVRDTSR